MIYYYTSRVVTVSSYEAFCRAMEIPFGKDSIQYRTPAENRMARAAALAVAVSRTAVFVDMNKGLSVIVHNPLILYNDEAIKRELENIDAMQIDGSEEGEFLEAARVEWDLLPFDFAIHPTSNPFV